MNLFKQLLATQLGKNYQDRSNRGHGNTAARRAIDTARGAEHIEFADEPIYTDRPEILKNGHLLTLISGPDSPARRALKNL